MSSPGMSRSGRAVKRPAKFLDSELTKSGRKSSSGRVSVPLEAVDSPDIPKLSNQGSEESKPIKVKISLSDNNEIECSTVDDAAVCTTQEDSTPAQPLIDETAENPNINIAEDSKETSDQIESVEEEVVTEEIQNDTIPSFIDSCQQDDASTPETLSTNSCDEEEEEKLPEKSFNETNLTSDVIITKKCVELPPPPPSVKPFSEKPGFLPIVQPSIKPNEPVSNVVKQSVSVNPVKTIPAPAPVSISGINTIHTSLPGAQKFVVKVLNPPTGFIPKPQTLNIQQPAQIMAQPGSNIRTIQAKKIIQIPKNTVKSPVKNEQSAASKLFNSMTSSSSGEIVSPTSKPRPTGRGKAGSDSGDDFDEKSNSKSSTPTKTKKSKKDKSEKRMAPLSPYMLWSRANRARVVEGCPGLDFISTSRKLGDAWNDLPIKDKMYWKKKAKELTKARLDGAANNMITTGKLVPGSGKIVSTLEAMSADRDLDDDDPSIANMSFVGRFSATTKPRRLATTVRINTPSKSKSSASVKGSSHKSQSPQQNPFAINETYSKNSLSPYGSAAIGIRPLDAAAYLRILGQSMKDIGKKLQANGSTGGVTDCDGQIESRLLDAAICSLTPLLSLTQNLPSLRSREIQLELSKAMDNLSFVMPGSL